MTNSIGRNSDRGSSDRPNPTLEVARAHRTQISEVFSAGMDPAERAKTERELAELRAMKPGMIGECMKVSLATVPLAPLTVRGSGAISSSASIKIADSAAALAAKLNDPRPKKDFSDIATEIRLHAAERPIDSPRMDSAISDIRAGPP